MCVGMQLERNGILDWLRMAAARPEVTFVWYGRTDPRMLTAAVSQALAAAPPNVRFPGYVNAATPRDAYAGADAFCFLSREETEGIVLLEALACGAPCWCGGPLYREQFPDGVLTHQVAEDGPDLPGRAASRLSPGGDRRATAPSLPRGAVRDAARVAPR